MNKKTRLVKLPVIGPNLIKFVISNSDIQSVLSIGTKAEEMVLQHKNLIIKVKCHKVKSDPKMLLSTI